LKIALFSNITGYGHPTSIQGIAHDKIESVTALLSGPAQAEVHQPIPVPCPNSMIQQARNKSVIVLIDIEGDGIVTDLAGQGPGLEVARKFSP
jgi:hypothetical protein